AVLVGQVDLDRVVAGAVDVGVRNVAVRRVGVALRVAPVDDPLGPRVLTRIGDRAEVERVARALVLRRVAADRDRRGDVADRHGVAGRGGGIVVGGRWQGR